MTTDPTKILDKMVPSSYPSKDAMVAYLSAGDPKARFRELAKRLHPDGGGSADAFRDLMEAKAELEDDLFDLMD